MSNKDSPTAQKRRELCGYKGPTDRDGCCRCYFSSVIEYEPAQLRCVRYTLRVHKLAICPSFTRERPPLIPTVNANKQLATDVVARQAA